jgi:hypothetical protein
MVYEVVVGNIGTVHHGNDRRTAEHVFAEYVSQSKAGYGRASGEPVTLLGDGEILKEYAGERTGMDGRRGGLNDREREQWIQNDEGLYNWWKSTRQAISKFIKENREELDHLIMAALNAPPSKGPYLMGAKGRYRQMWSLDVFYPGKGWESRVISYDRESLLQDAKFHEEEFGTKVRVVPVENVR